VQTGLCGDYSVLVSNAAGSTASPAATLIVINPPPVLTTAGAGTVTTNGFSFGMSVPAGATFVVEASTNMRDWAPIATNVAAAASVVFTDTAAPNHPRRFYRALLR
jgi:hypothetical protein